MTHLKRIFACLTLPAFLFILLIGPLSSLPASSRASARPLPPLSLQAAVVATVTVGNNPYGVGVNPIDQPHLCGERLQRQRLGD